MSREGGDGGAYREKVSGRVAAGREIIVVGDAYRHAMTSHRQAATSRRRLVASSAAIRDASLVLALAKFQRVGGRVLFRAI